MRAGRRRLVRLVGFYNRLIDGFVTLAGSRFAETIGVEKWQRTQRLWRVGIRGHCGASNVDGTSTWWQTTVGPDQKGLYPSSTRPALLDEIRPLQINSGMPSAIQDVRKIALRYPPVRDVMLKDKSMMNILTWISRSKLIRRFYNISLTMLT